MKLLGVFFSLIFVSIAAVLPSGSCFSAPLVSGISANEINVNTDFKGAKILLFGVKSDIGDVVIVVRGPKKNFIVSKKEHIFGVWFNGQRVEFRDGYSYYSMFSTFRDGEMAENDLRQYELGKNNVSFAAAKPIAPIKSNEFKVQLINLLEENNLYESGAQRIDFLDENLFKIFINFPKNLVLGTYVIEIYLINNGSVLSFQSIPVYVNQVGISSKISNFAKNQSVLYGLFSVLIALIVGFFANYLFFKFIKK